MNKFFILAVAIFCFFNAAGQSATYLQEIKAFQKNYVATHEVVPTAEHRYFNFFPVDESYKLMAVFTRIEEAADVTLKTSGTKAKQYRRYGVLQFRLRDTLLQLTVFQSEELAKTAEYRNYLFLPFTDKTSGDESYGGGRYLDLDLTMIRDNKILIDFNKAYNPYCAYASGYNCPIPPQENDLPIAIKAGEKDFLKPVH